MIRKYYVTGSEKYIKEKIRKITEEENERGIITCLNNPEFTDF